MHISRDTLDDLMRASFESLLRSKTRIVATKGECREIYGVILELKNPRARLSRTENRNKVISCLGEFLWCLSGSNDLKFIQHYIPKYEEFSDDKIILNGAYGPRIFSEAENNQYEKIRKILTEKPTSRQAVIQVFSSADTDKETKDVPCTCTLQFVIRNGLLHLLASMRSNDAYLGLPHDVFVFTMIQEMLAVDLGVNLGTYKHSVGSFHLYEKNVGGVKDYLLEGFQESVSMPPMPKENLWASLKAVVGLEMKIRNKNFLIFKELGLDSYWLDILRLLQMHALPKDTRNSLRALVSLKEDMSTKFYEDYIRKKENALIKSSELEPNLFDKK